MKKQLMKKQICKDCLYAKINVKIKNNIIQEPLNNDKVRCSKNNWLKTKTYKEIKNNFVYICDNFELDVIDKII